MSVPGMVYPTQKGMLAGNPRDSAIQQTANMNQKQANLNNAVGGSGRRRLRRRSRRKTKKTKKRVRRIRKTRKRLCRCRRRRGGTIAVPQYQMQYTSQGGPGTDPNSQIQQNAQVGTQMAANSKYDNLA